MDPDLINAGKVRFFFQRPFWEKGKDMSHIMGDKQLNPIVRVYMPIIRIPIKGGMSLSPI